MKALQFNISREFGLRNVLKKLNRQLEKVADSFGYMHEFYLEPNSEAELEKYKKSIWDIYYEYAED